MKNPDQLLDRLAHKPSEAAVLGSMIQEPGITGDVARMLATGDFFTEAHRTVFAAILEVWRDVPTFDGLLIREHLERAGLLDRIGGLAYLQDIEKTVPHSANWRYYAQIVLARRHFRDLVQATEKMEAVLDDGSDVAQQTEAIQRIALELDTEQPENIHRAKDAAISAGIPEGNRTSNRFENSKSIPDIYCLIITP